MGVVVSLFASRRQNAASVEGICGFAMLQVTKNFDYFKPVEQAVRAMLQHPHFPVVRVDQGAILWATDLTDSISPESREIAFAVSRSRLQHECRGWDPMDLPACASLLECDAEPLLRSALGAAALLWQVAEYPENVITTWEDYNNTFSQANFP